jgi:hypothetical protein
MRAATLIALVLVLAVAGCGGGNDKKTIPAGNAQSLIAGLDRVSDQFDNGACNGAQAKVSDLQNAADNLPSSVDPEVKKNIQDGLQRLNDLVQRDCQRSETTTTSSTTSSTTPTTTSTTTTTSSSSPTTTSTTSTSTSSSDTGGVEPPNGGTGPGGATGQ